MPETLGTRSASHLANSAWIAPEPRPIAAFQQGKTTMQNAKVRELANFIWNSADTLRGKFKAHDYGKVIMPFFVLRRLDCLLAETQEATIEMANTLPEGIDEDTRDLLLFDVAKAGKVYNLSPLNFARIKGQNPTDLHDNLIAYITGFSANMRDIFIDKFKFLEQLKELKDHDILWEVFEQFTDVDLSPNEVSNLEMGYAFEELIRRFSEQSNETAGEHFTPREVVHLIVDLLIANDKALTGRGLIRTVYDPACGTGGILSIAEAEIKAINEGVRVELYGQEQNKESYAICRSDMLVTGHDPEQIAFGDTLANDQHRGQRFHWMMSNPPYGVDWKASADAVKAEWKELGDEGRFGAGLPRISDGQLLFLQHMISKMRDDEQGSQIGIVMNGAPMGTGDAGSGESEIRRWLFESDYVTAIIALPPDLFYNTGIQTFIWILNNRKPDSQQNKVLIIDASSEEFSQPLRKSLGDKANFITDEARSKIVNAFTDGFSGKGSSFAEVFPVSSFAYRLIRIQQPKRRRFCVDEDGMARLSETKPFSQLEQPEKDLLISILSDPIFGKSWSDGNAFHAKLAGAATDKEFKITAPLRSAIEDSFGTLDPEAEIIRDNKGKPEPDKLLQYFERVPVDRKWEEFFAEEVEPFAPGAWVDTKYIDRTDKKVGRLGYSVPYNTLFAKFERPPALSNVNANIAALEDNLAQLLTKVISK